MMCVLVAIIRYAHVCCVVGSMCVIDEYMLD